MSKIIKIGVIGAQFAGQFHGDVWQQTPGAQIVAVADRDGTAAEAFKKKYNVRDAYTTADDMFQNQDIDVVDICLPNFLHTEFAIAAMEAGKHVICEKPLATTLEDAKKIRSVQEKTGVKFFYAEDWIFAPALIRAKEIIAKGGIGDVLYCRGKESHNGSHSPFAQTIEYCGGGAMIHLAIHAAGFFYDMYGMPKMVTGNCSDGGHKNLKHKKLEGEDWGIAILDYENGPKVVMEGNYITVGGMEDCIEFYGTKGVLKVDLTFGSPLSVYSQEGIDYAVEKTDFTYGWTRPAVDEWESLGYKRELQHFVDCMLDDGVTQARGTTIQGGLSALKIVEALYVSHAEKRAVALQ